MRCRMRDYRIRPPKDAQQQADGIVCEHIVWRLSPSGRWAPDNGEPGLAFVAGVMHYYPEVECRCRGASTCVSRISAAKTLSQGVGSANGRMIRAKRVIDPVIDKGTRRG
jgi:hypothetical protein